MASPLTSADTAHTIPALSGVVSLVGMGVVSPVDVGVVSLVVLGVVALVGVGVAWSIM